MRWANIGRGSWIDGILWWGAPYESAGLAVEVAGRRCLGASVVVGGESTDVGLWLGLGVASVHLHLRDLFPRSWRQAARAWAERRVEVLNERRVRDPRESSPAHAYEIDPFEGRTTGFYVFEGALNVQLWNGPHGWSCRDRSVAPWDGNGWTWHVDLVAALIGEARYEEEPGTTHETAVVMPEGRYPATVRVYRCRWNRRFWNGRWLWRAEVDVPGGVPLPGKGENAWDCDDDAVFAQTVGAARRYIDVVNAAQQLALGVLADRAKRAGLDWIPSDGWPPHMRPPGAPSNAA